MAAPSTVSRRYPALALTPLVLGLVLSSSAFAAQPTVQQCLEASDASLDLETQGQLLATRDALEVCASLACPEEVRDECARRIALVQDNIPSVLCEVRDESGRLRHDALVTVDGRGPGGPATELIELEPGTHVLTARAPGLVAVTQRVALSTRDKERPVRFVLRNATLPRKLAAFPPRRAAALVVGGVGAAALTTASVFAVVALDRKQEAQMLCPEATCPSARGSERWADAWRAGNLATGFAVGGTLAFIAATGLWFSVDGRSTAVAIAPGRVQLQARF